MIEELKLKIRSVVGDAVKVGREFFTYTNSKVFTLSEPNIVSITDVDKNGADLESGESYSFDSATNKLTIVANLVYGDELEVAYNYYSKYSDKEIIYYIRAALVYLSVFGCKDFELEEVSTDNYELYPTPTNKELDLIVLVASILMKPNYSEYRLSNNVTIRYPRTEDKDTKIRKLIVRSQSRTGLIGLIDLGATNSD